jgi:hypothetical protein
MNAQKPIPAPNDFGRISSQYVPTKVAIKVNVTT